MNRLISSAPMVALLGFVAAASFVGPSLRAEAQGSNALIEFRYFRDVGNSRSSHARYWMNVTKDAQGNPVYSFYDNRSHRTFRDLAHILAEWLALEHQRGRQTGVKRIFVGPPLSRFAMYPPLYGTPFQQNRIRELNTELSDYDKLIAGSPLVLDSADIKPPSAARMEQIGDRPTPVLDLHFTAKGTSEFATFTTKHVKSIMAIIVWDKILSAPTIEEPISGGNTMVTFNSLADAQTLARELNSPGGQR